MKTFLQESKDPHISRTNRTIWLCQYSSLRLGLTRKIQPSSLSLSLNVIANYATDFLRGVSGNPNVKLDIVVEKNDKTCKKISYEGSIDGLKDLPAVIREAAR